MTDQDKKIENKQLKSGAIVKIKSTGRISILASIQEVHNRYQLRNVSGWQYDINDLEYLDNDSILSELERLQNELVNQVKRNDKHRETNRKLREELYGWKSHRSELVTKNKELLGRLHSAQQRMELIRDKLLDIFTGLEEIEEESSHEDACITKINGIARHLIEEFGEEPA